MPLHDWSKTDGWSGAQLYWLCELAQSLKPLMPANERVYLGHSPVVPNDPPPAVIRRPPGATLPRLDCDEVDLFEPNREVECCPGVLDHDRSAYVERDGRLLAVIELAPEPFLDPANESAKYVTRYLGYLTNGVQLLLVDVHPRPSPSFADQIAQRLGIADEPPLTAPFVASYRVHPDKPGGFSYIDFRRASLVVGEPLPTIPLALSYPKIVPVDLEGTYTRAATAAYLT